MTWNLPDLEPGFSHQIVLTVLVDVLASGDITNLAGVTAVAPGDSVVSDSDAATASAAPAECDRHPPDTHENKHHDQHNAKH